MDEHFRAFSFVDRITSIESGLKITGTYTPPSALEEFPVSLVAEAVGQLAAWVAMSETGFKRRPLAGLAGAVELKSEVPPGQSIALSAELETLDSQAIAYHGTAHVNGTEVLRLSDCVGPMASTEEFDAPESLADRFELLRNSGAEPGSFGGTPSLLPVQTGGEFGQHKTATLQVPDSATFFLDHFPRRPVFPGTLLMHSQLMLTASLMSELPLEQAGHVWKARRVTDVKLRSFISPGDTLLLEAKVKACSATEARLSVEGRQANRVVSRARVTFIAEESI